ncbi:chemotaxis protein CheA [Biostraticola tofi]|uniref:Chemotaxis protein CheA n=1 Tax=Biostraticola tofi TaxID=466109 RepID=A0A4R3YUR8_9GAMM|nr:chemotaxis protein CheA [Biostraticola tofi]TCV95528.1 CheA signal transduction histidine kinase [Biostraticola tofi]
MDITELYQTFFDEADELLADMEQQLLAIDLDAPDQERLNAIFRAAHSIKGGAGTFGFVMLQQTTHLLENLLDHARTGAMALNDDILTVFLQAKDHIQDQITDYKAGEEPDELRFESICQALSQLAVLPASGACVSGQAKTESADVDDHLMTVCLHQLEQGQSEVLVEELTHLGTVLNHQQQDGVYIISLQSTLSEDDICAVLCFVIEPEQIKITSATLDKAAASDTGATDLSAASTMPASAGISTASDGVATAAAPGAAAAPLPSTTAVAAGGTPQLDSASTRPRAAESGSIRVAVEKVDKIINLLGELVISQSMLKQLSASLDPSVGDELLISISQLEHNARDLQESVMSIRMMPLQYVFGRFPRLVRDLAGKLNKQCELQIKGGSTELDKSLIEKIIDPLTHLIRNSLDHGIEDVATRLANGKPATGTLTLSAEHRGSHIILEISDDGAGLNRERILAKALSQGMDIAENISDEEVWQLIFAPGFSTAEHVTDVSGRGVGMDVVKRNIKDLGGGIEIRSAPNQGTLVRILLPLTLAILDGMSVRVGGETFILPLNSVVESLKPEEQELHPISRGECMLQVRGEYLPLFELHRVFDIKDAQEDPSKAIAVILQGAKMRYALMVDQLIDQHQVVVKDLEMNYRRVGGVSAATILGDGKVALIIDAVALPQICQDKRLSCA